jgi:hypothetical protein
MRAGCTGAFGVLYFRSNSDSGSASENLVRLITVYQIFDLLCLILFLAARDCHAARLKGVLPVWSVFLFLFAGVNDGCMIRYSE